jgi:hypothetical protein
LTVVIALPLTPALAQTVSETFAGRVVTFETPVGYKLAGRNSPDPAALFLLYRTPHRADCRNGLFFVMLMDLPATEGGDSMTPQQLAATVLAPIGRGRDGWTVSESVVVVDGDSAIRYSWSGSSIPKPDPPAREPMRGVVIVGIKEGLGFALRVDDFEPQATETLPVGEAALHTFHVQETP